jgi:hypothetical protein
VTTVEAWGLKLTPDGAHARALAAYNGSRVILGVRPEHLMLGDGAPDYASLHPGYDFENHFKIWLRNSFVRSCCG